MAQPPISPPGVEVKHLGQVAYLATWQAMQDFTAQRQPDTPDQIWLCEHPPVFTQGLAGLAQHLLVPGDIPVVHTNRGGQVTYHGPGQVVAYTLIDLKRAGYFVKELVYRIEEAVIKTLMPSAATLPKPAKSGVEAMSSADVFCGRCGKRA